MLSLASPAAAQTEGGDTLGQDEAAIAEARERYAQGAEFFRRERYSAAIAELTEAYRLWQNPTILFALGQAYEGDGQVQAAIDTYQRYLDTTPATDERRTDIEGRIRALNQLLATVRIESNTAGTVVINGQEVGTAPGEIRVPTGRHQIEVRADGYRAERQTVTIAAGTTVPLTFTGSPTVRAVRSALPLPVKTKTPSEVAGLASGVGSWIQKPFEAMALEKAVVVSSTRALSEIVTDIRKVVAETKLWRNNLEARRTVLAQILDYARS